MFRQIFSAEKRGLGAHIRPQIPAALHRPEAARVRHTVRREPALRGPLNATLPLLHAARSHRVHVPVTRYRSPASRATSIRPTALPVTLALPVIRALIPAHSAGRHRARGRGTRTGLGSAERRARDGSRHSTVRKAAIYLGHTAFLRGRTRTILITLTSQRENWRWRWAESISRLGFSRGARREWIGAVGVAAVDLRAAFLGSLAVGVKITRRTHAENTIGYGACSDLGLGAEWRWDGGGEGSGAVERSSVALGTALLGSRAVGVEVTLATHAVDIQGGRARSGAWLRVEIALAGADFYEQEKAAA